MGSQTGGYIVKVEIGNATLYLGDCMEILPTLGKVDAVITDPPYGLGEKLNGNGEWSKGFHVAPEWDKSTIPLEFIKNLICISKEAVVWGGNYYDLGISRGWLLWDKCQEHTSAHAEMAWTNLDIPVRTYRLSRVEAYSKMDKQHPTQKPLGLIEWCIDKCKSNPQTILDPFMGSGTTGVAAVRMDRKFIGIEREQKYFDIACKRIEQEQAQTKLF